MVDESTVCFNVETAVGVAALIEEVSDVESDSWTIPTTDVVAAVDALSYAAFTAVGVAALDDEVSDVESLSWETPGVVVDAAAGAAHLIPNVPWLESAVKTYPSLPPGSCKLSTASFPVPTNKSPLVSIVERETCALFTETTPAIDCSRSYKYFVQKLNLS